MKVPFHNVHFGATEVQAVMNALETNWLSPRGPAVAKMGMEWAEKIGMKYGLACSSGTGAIHLALTVAGVGRGDKVAVPTYTCSPTVFPVSYLGGVPVFVDCEFETYGMDPDALRQVLAGHDIKAAVSVHLYGAACQDQIVDICREAGVPLIEDACESDGALYRDLNGIVGSRGDFGTFSFRGDKVLTALGTGGVVTTNDEAAFELLQYYCDLGLHNTSAMGRYRDLPVVGYNYEISNAAAAFGRAQIERLPEIIELRRANADKWRACLDGGDAVQPMPDYPGHVYYQFPLMFDTGSDYRVLDRLGERLMERGVPFIPPFWPMHWQPPYESAESCVKTACPKAEAAGQSVLLFPCYPGLAGEQIEYMAQVCLEEAPTAAGTPA